MGSFACQCGHIMRDNVSTHEFGGEFYWDKDREDWLEEVSEAIASFIQAVASGKREEWFEQSPHFRHYFNQAYLPAGPDREVIFDLLLSATLEKALAVYRCPNCMRLYLQQEPGKNMWLEFRPERSIDAESPVHKVVAIEPAA